MLLQKKVTTKRFKIELPEDTAGALLMELYKSNVSLRQIPFVPDTLTMKHIAKAAMWLCDEDGKVGLLIMGEPGNGKTTLLRSMRDLINRLHESARASEEKKLIIVDALEIGKAGRDDKSGAPYLKKLQREELLGIDDVGLDSAIVNSYANLNSPMEELLTFRYDKQLFTIITTNLTPKQIREKYGDRMADRFNEMFDRIVFENNTYRK